MTESHWNNPANPSSTGYDLDDPRQREAFKAAKAEGIANGYQAQLDRETVRWRDWVRDYYAAGAGGVSVSGSGPGGFEPVDFARCLSRARDVAAARKAWRESPAGRVALALAEVETNVGRAPAVIEDLREAMARGDGSAERSARVLNELAARLFTLSEQIVAESKA